MLSAALDSPEFLENLHMMLPTWLASLTLIFPVEQRLVGGPLSLSRCPFAFNSVHATKEILY